MPQPDATAPHGAPPVTVADLSAALGDLDVDVTAADVVLALEGSRCRIVVADEPGAADLLEDDPRDGATVEREVAGVIDGYRYDDHDRDQLAWVIVADDAGGHEYIALDDVEGLVVWADPAAVHATLAGGSPPAAGRSPA